MQKKIQVLYIDDEINNLVGFKANFRYQYDIYIASSTREAEDILAENPDIRIIFCDQRMPDELGVNFLQRIKREYPRPIRILLTAYADMETVVDAVNKGHIFRFVRKPWVEEEIISSIEEADRFYVANSLLDIQNEQLRKAYDELDKFAYSVSHDLRDPLSGVLSAVKLALQFDQVEHIHELLGLMVDSLTKLDAYIDSLRDYYLLRRGGLTLSDINFTQLFEDIGEFYKVSTRSNEVILTTHVDQNSVFRSDKVVLELILHNLLSNAFKYQRQNFDGKAIELAVKVAHSEAVITVRDTGIGIPEEHLDDIFTLFFRASDQAQGMGFGLYNVQSALLKLKGSIEVESKLGSGTTFKVVIPSK
ncbi:sensor histidine kinase [Sphingobacterium deserti]|uniref:histidine kinase n=1 Tax=Sphingobacterium deserti TaxID=1229276 RepID=A0A0B8SZ41_9SPHI|nr:hybrid sensor histidine kinase/response regulator [Sphingobacterium deserti]KGE12862.1 response regulator receiver sensor signal transduction histidine kinase [Sphingobacterium deserti]